MLITFKEKVLKIPSGSALDLHAPQKVHLSFSHCLPGIFALWAVWHYELFINMKVLFLFLVTVATGRLQILVIHRVNLITVFIKHSLLLLHLLKFLGRERLLLYRLSNYLNKASIMSGNSQTSLGQDAPILMSFK